LSNLFNRYPSVRAEKSYLGTFNSLSKVGGNITEHGPVSLITEVPHWMGHKQTELSTVDFSFYGTSLVATLVSPKVIVKPGKLKAAAARYERALKPVGIDCRYETTPDGGIRIFMATQREDPESKAELFRILEGSERLFEADVRATGH
jgi:hypothetical protein